MRWGDSYSGYGEQYYEYNHGDQYQETSQHEHIKDDPITYDNNYVYKSYNNL